MMKKREVSRNDESIVQDMFHLEGKEIYTNCNMVTRKGEGTVRKDSQVNNVKLTINCTLQKAT